MDSRASKIRDSFDKALDVLAENRPDGLMYDVFIYARDTEVRDKDNPDGHIAFRHDMQLTLYDKKTIKEFIDEDFSDYAN